MATDENTTRFLNVDLDLKATVDLSPLVSSMAPGAFALHAEATSDGFWANLELDEDPQDADAAICAFAQLIDGLPPAARALWDEATVRDFNVGVQAGTSPHQYELSFRPDTLRAASQLGARIVFTVYAASASNAQSAKP